jgi:hypothetical protein
LLSSSARQKTLETSLAIIFERERKRDRATKLHSFWGTELPDGSIANRNFLQAFPIEDLLQGNAIPEGESDFCL